MGEIWRHTVRTAFFLTGLCMVLTVSGCGGVTDQDLQDLQSANAITKKDAIARIIAKPSFPIFLWDRLVGQEEREKAARIMGDLLAAGKEPKQIQIALIKALGKLGRSMPIPVEVLRGFLKEKDAQLRLLAVEALGKARDKKAVPELLELLTKEPEPYVVIWALGEIGAVEAVPVLNRLLASQEKYISFNAYKALTKIGKARTNGDTQSNSSTTAWLRIDWLSTMLEHYREFMADLYRMVS